MRSLTGWITVNGNHIPIDDEGKPVGGQMKAVGGKDSGFKYSGHLNESVGKVGKMVDSVSGKLSKMTGGVINKGVVNWMLANPGATEDDLVEEIRKSYVKKSGTVGMAKSYASSKSAMTDASVGKNPKEHVGKEAETARTVGGYTRKNDFKNGYGTTSAADRESQYGVTIKDNTDENGNWTAEREALHSKIIDDAFEGVKKPEGKPVTTFMGGGPASGKSTAIKGLGEKIGVPAKGDAVVVDPDACKEPLPEYDKKKPGPVHEESSALAKRISKLSQDNGYSTLVDGTGDGSIESMRKKIQQARDAGNAVNGVYVFTTIDEALARNRNRDRSVDDDIVIGTHKKIPGILEAIAPDFDNVKLVACLNDKKPKIVAEGGGGKPLTIYDEELYKVFKDNENYQKK